MPISLLTSSNPISSTLKLILLILQSPEFDTDFKFFKGKFYLLEINTQPGMTNLSLVPEIALYKGISFIKLIEMILGNASKKK